MPPRPKSKPGRVAVFEVLDNDNDNDTANANAAQPTTNAEGKPTTTTTTWWRGKLAASSIRAQAVRDRQDRLKLALLYAAFAGAAALQHAHNLVQYWLDDDGSGHGSGGMSGSGSSAADAHEEERPFSLFRSLASALARGGSGSSGADAHGEEEERPFSLLRSLASALTALVGAGWGNSCQASISWDAVLSGGACLCYMLATGTRPTVVVAGAAPAAASSSSSSSSSSSLPSFISNGGLPYVLASPFVSVAASFSMFLAVGSWNEAEAAEDIARGSAEAD